MYLGTSTTTYKLIRTPAWSGGHRACKAQAEAHLVGVPTQLANSLPVLEDFECFDDPSLARIQTSRSPGFVHSGVRGLHPSYSGEYDSQRLSETSKEASLYLHVSLFPIQSERACEKLQARCGDDFKRRTSIRKTRGMGTSGSRQITKNHLMLKSFARDSQFPRPRERPAPCSLNPAAVSVMDWPARIMRWPSRSRRFKRGDGA